MGMLKVFAGITCLSFMLVMPTLGVAKSFTEEKRYICETSQATGWEEGWEEGREEGRARWEKKRQGSKQQGGGQGRGGRGRGGRGCNGDGG